VSVGCLLYIYNSRRPPMKFLATQQLKLVSSQRKHRCQGGTHNLHSQQLQYSCFVKHSQQLQYSCFVKHSQQLQYVCLSSFNNYSTRVLSSFRLPTIISYARSSTFYCWFLRFFWFFFYFWIFKPCCEAPSGHLESLTACELGVIRF